MQIEVVDDHSTKDDPEAVVRELAGDRVSFYRQPQNVGHVKNFNTCLQRSRGKLIHLLHGDDGVRNGFYQKMQKAFDAQPNIGAAFCRQIYMDENGHWKSLSSLEQPDNGVIENWLEKIAVINRLQPPSIVIQRCVYEKLGGFDSRILSIGEDWEMWVRIAAYYPVWYEVEPLPLYRVHSSSLTGRGMQTGQNIQDFQQAIEITRSYLPNEIARNLSKKARENLAIEVLKKVPQLFKIGDWATAKMQISGALKLSVSWRVVQNLIFIVLLSRKYWNKHPTKSY
jgi:glycosyltransferase involved in cell wall biosynthesis